MIDRDDPQLVSFLHRLLPADADADRPVGLVLADWLEERGDDRAADVRAIAAFRLPEVTFPRATQLLPWPRSDEDDEDVDDTPLPPQPIWRWPPPDHPDPPFWDLLAELFLDGRTYVRWHADPNSEPGFRMLLEIDRYTNGHVVPREQLTATLERCLAEMIAALLGWTPHKLHRRQGKG